MQLPVEVGAPPSAGHSRSGTGQIPRNCRETTAGAASLTLIFLASRHLAVGSPATRTENMSGGDGFASPPYCSLKAAKRERRSEKCKTLAFKTAPTCFASPQSWPRSGNRVQVGALAVTDVLGAFQLEHAAAGFQERERRSHLLPAHLGGDPRSESLDRSVMVPQPRSPRTRWARRTAGEWRIGADHAGKLGPVAG